GGAGLDLVDRLARRQHFPVALLKAAGGLGRPEVVVGPPGPVAAMGCELPLPAGVGVEVTALLVLDEGDRRVVVHEGAEAGLAAAERLDRLALAFAEGFLGPKAVADLAGDQQTERLTTLGVDGVDGDMDGD